MSQKHFLLKGTFYPYCSRHSHPCNGIFYRIFLSRSFPAEEIGLYQLIFPVYTLAYAATSAGIETALARLVAASSAKAVCKSLFLPESSTALFSFSFHLLSFSVAEKCCFPHHSHTLVIPDAPLSSSLIAYALPFAALHSCSCGYFLGLKQIRLPALSQLFEQLVRIFLLSSLYTADVHTAFTPSVAIAVLRNCRW